MAATNQTERERRDAEIRRIRAAALADLTEGRTELTECEAPLSGLFELAGHGEAAVQRAVDMAKGRVPAAGPNLQAARRAVGWALDNAEPLLISYGLQILATLHATGDVLETERAARDAVAKARVVAQLGKCGFEPCDLTEEPTDAELLSWARGCQSAKGLADGYDQGIYRLARELQSGPDFWGPIPAKFAYEAKADAAANALVALDQIETATRDTLSETYGKGGPRDRLAREYKGQLLLWRVGRTRDAIRAAATQSDAETEAA